MIDLIRREDVYDVLKKVNIREMPIYVFDKLWNGIKDLPSAEPERKKGEWIEYPDCLRYEGAYADDQIVCSVCHHVYSIIDNCTEEFDFCPHCGADMRGDR